MLRYPYQGPFVKRTRYTSKQARKFLPRRDKIFHLPTALAENDPFLRNLYGVVTFILDDHPYPSTREEYYQRTYDIQRELQHLHLPPVKQKFLDRLLQETGVTVVDLWQGSHIIVHDGGYLYDTWSKSPSVHPRFSSHYRDLPLQQYGINFNDHQLLFGKTAVNGLTWFQMEAHGFEPEEILSNPDLFMLHGQDFLKYRFHGMNVGPFGFSPHTETSDPIILPYRPLNPKKHRR